MTPTVTSARRIRVLRYLTCMFVFAATIGFAFREIVVAQQVETSQSVENRIDVLRFAELVQNTLVFQDDGQVSIDWGKAVEATESDLRGLASVAEDVNRGHVGIAFRDERGTRLYGNPEVLRNEGASDRLQQISTWRDGYGVAIYLDPVFMRRLRNFDGVALGATISFLILGSCGTGVGCWVAAVAWDWFWGQLFWPWVDGHFADSVIVHVPRWGWVYLQPFKQGAWWSGQWVWTWLWL